MIAAFLRILKAPLVTEFVTIALTALIGGIGGFLQYWYAYDPWLPSHIATMEEAFAVGMAAGVVGVYFVSPQTGSLSAGKLTAMALVFGFSGLAVMTKAQTVLISDSTPNAHAASAQQIDAEVKKIQSNLGTFASENPQDRERQIKNLTAQAKCLLDLSDLSDDDTVRTDDKECLYQIRSLLTYCASTGDVAAVNQADEAIRAYATARQYQRVAEFFPDEPSSTTNAPPAAASLLGEKIAQVNSPSTFVTDAPISNGPASTTPANGPRPPIVGWIKYCTLRGPVADTGSQPIDLARGYDGDRIFYPTGTATFPTNQVLEPEKPTPLPLKATTDTDVFIRQEYPTSSNEASFFSHTPDYYVPQGTPLVTDEVVLAKRGGNWSIWFHFSTGLQDHVVATNRIPPSQ